METVLYNKIIAKTKEICDDYNELSSDYHRAMSTLKTNENFNKLLELEILLKEQTQIECAHAIKKGFDLEKENINLERLNEYGELFDTELDETVNTRELEELESYRKLKEKIKIADNEIMNLFQNDSDTIVALFDAYGSFNFELTRAAYTLGCEIKQYSKLIMNMHI